VGRPLWLVGSSEEEPVIQREKILHDGGFPLHSKGGILYATSMACPADGTATVRSLGLTGEASGLEFQSVGLLGSPPKVDWLRTTNALNLNLPADAACKHGFCAASEGC